MSNLAVIRNLDKRLAQEIPTLTVELLDNLKAWRQAQADYADARRRLVERGLRRGQSELVAEQRAGEHPVIRESISFTTYYREQAAMCASALAVLRDIREDMQ